MSARLTIGDLDAGVRRATNGLEHTTVGRVEAVTVVDQVVSCAVLRGLRSRDLWDMDDDGWADLWAAAFGMSSDWRRLVHNAVLLAEYESWNDQ